MKIQKILCVLLLATLFGCSSSDKLSVKDKNSITAFKLYEKAKSAMQANNYLTAVRYLEQLSSLYPFGAYAHDSQLSLVYCYYKLGQNAKADAISDRFIRQNPSHKDLDYAYYMKGLVNFSSETNRFFDADLSERDTASARKSFDDFAELLRLFPKSQYAQDARKRMIYLRNNLAKQELYIANYYMKRQAYQAAIARAKYVIDHYPKTPSTPYALKMMVVGYDLLGLPDLAENSRRVLLLNYPDFKG